MSNAALHVTKDTKSICIDIFDMILFLPARINSSNIPRGPSPLGGTSNRVIVKTPCLIRELLLNELSHGIHGTHGGFDHRETKKPFGFGGIL